MSSQFHAPATLLRDKYPANTAYKAEWAPE
jgi:hypothetical protein